ncbi:MAG: hypothetical protein JWO41_870 [Candidatus Saccharibacteria bacterium]|nr:hypothetical protein [Candidatus Saccharibacteria bacterium]
MTKHNQVGAVNALLLPLIITSMIAIGFIGFAVWAATGRQDYKNNADKKIAAAVTIAKQQEDTLKDKQFAEDAKKPLITYTGPDTYGSIKVSYPKTWSGYVDASGNTDVLLNGFFNPGVVPGIAADSSVFALRVRVLGQTYAQTLVSLSSLQKDNKVKVEPYALPQVPSRIGIKATGVLPDGSSGVAVFIQLRDKTLEISTEGSQYLDDFNNIILKNLTFVP